MKIVIESLFDILKNKAAYKIKSDGGYIKLSPGVLKCDRVAMSKIMGYYGSVSPVREGIYYILQISTKIKLISYIRYCRKFSSDKTQHFPL